MARANGASHNPSIHLPPLWRITGAAVLPAATHRVAKPKALGLWPEENQDRSLAQNYDATIMILISRYSIVKQKQRRFVFRDRRRKWRGADTLWWAAKHGPLLAHAGHSAVAPVW